MIWTSDIKWILTYLVLVTFFWLLWEFIPA
jgi:hypothetical protein